MNEPLRMRDDPEAAPQARALIARAARSRPMREDERARSVARVDRLLAVPAAAGLLLWLKGVAVAAGLGVVGVVAVTEVLPRLRAPTHSPTAVSTVLPPAPPRAPGPSAGPPSPEAPSSAASAPPARPLPPAPAMTAPRTAPAPSSAGSSESDRLAREVSLLEAARARLETDPAAALAGLNAHAAEFPSGMLGMEREMLAIDALRRMGRVAEARTRARALLEKARGSIYEDRVRAILEALPAPP